MRFMQSAKEKNKSVKMTPGQIAAELGVSVSTIARWKNKGCPFEETRRNAIGRGASRPRFNLETVKNWVQEQRQKDSKSCMESRTAGTAGKGVEA